MAKVRVFIDFWNFKISVEKISKLPLNIDWESLGLLTAMSVSNLGYARLEGAALIEGTHIYGSYSSGWQIDLARDMCTKIAKLPGVFPVFKKRKRATPCICPKCKSKISLNPEEGIDVRLAVDVVKFSSFDPETVIVLATNDGDFIPLVEYLTGLGRKIVHLSSKTGNEELSTKAWASISIEALDPAVFPLDKAHTIVIRVKNDDGYKHLEQELKRREIEYKSIYLLTTKEGEYDLLRLFRENQDYANNFENIQGTIHKLAPNKVISGIYDALDIAKARPELLRGPFVLHNGSILNRPKISQHLGISFE